GRRGPLLEMPGDELDNLVSGYPTVTKSGMPLSTNDMAALAETLVDLDATRPGMFVLRFLQTTAPGADSGISFKIGDEVEILEAGSSTSLIKGEVTSLEVDYGQGGQRSVVRGYDKSHRMHRARKYRAFPNMKDSDIVSQLASDASMTANADTTTSVHT